MESMEMICGMARFRRLRVGDLVEGINKGEWKILMAIGELPAPVKVSAITEVLPMPAPALSRWLRALERKGFVRRETDPADRRNTLVSLTPEGEAKAEEIRSILDAYMAAVTERMGDARLRALFGELEELAQISEEEIERLKHEESC